jgi:hypothetical protein
MKCFKAPWTWNDSLAQPKQWKKDMRFGTWNISSLYRVGAIKSEMGELEKCKLDLVGVQGVRWEGRDIKQQTIIHFSVGNGMLITTYRQDFSYITLV